MRARDFLIDAAPATAPTVAPRPTAPSAVEPVAAKGSPSALNYDNPADARGYPHWKYLTIDYINDNLPPEIEKLKSPGGMFDTSKVTTSLIEKLASKYPNGPYAVRRIPAPGRDSFSNLMILDPAGIEKVKQQTIQALTDYNRLNRPLSHYFNPEREYGPNALPGHRGAAKGVENLAKKFEPRDINFYLEAYQLAVQNQLVSPIPPDQWLMILLTEGRSDFGFNITQWKNQRGPADAKFEEQLKTMGIVNDGQTGFIAMIRAKQNIAKRTGKPFYQAWNGGAAHVGNYNNQVAAVKDPRNKPLLDLITQALA